MSGSGEAFARESVEKVSCPVTTFQRTEPAGKLPLGEAVSPTQNFWPKRTQAGVTLGLRPWQGTAGTRRNAKEDKIRKPQAPAADQTWEASSIAADSAFALATANARA